MAGGILTLQVVKEPTSSANTITLYANGSLATTNTLISNQVSSANITSTTISSASTTSNTLVISNTAYATIGTLTDGATITPDLGAYNNYTVTLGGNRTLANPTNANVGQSGVIYVVQDGTGSRTLAFGSNWKFPANTAPTLTTTANAVDALFYVVRTASSITVNSILNVG